MTLSKESKWKYHYISCIYPDCDWKAYDHRPKTRLQNHLIHKHKVKKELDKIKEDILELKCDMRAQRLIH